MAAATTLAEFEVLIKGLYDEAEQIGNGTFVFQMLSALWKQFSTLSCRQAIDAWFPSEKENFDALLKTKRQSKTRPPVGTTVEFIVSLYDAKGWNQRGNLRVGSVAARVPAQVDEDDDEDDNNDEEVLCGKTTDDDEASYNPESSVDDEEEGSVDDEEEDDDEPFEMEELDSLVADQNEHEPPVNRKRVRKEDAGANMSVSESNLTTKNWLERFCEPACASPSGDGQPAACNIFDDVFAKAFQDGTKQQTVPWNLNQMGECIIPYGAKHMRNKKLFNAELGIPELQWFEQVCRQDLMLSLALDPFCTVYQGQKPAM